MYQRGVVWSDTAVSTPDADLISRYQSLVRHSADIITLTASDGTVEYQSPSVERVLGYDQDALVGESVFDYVHPEDRDRIQSAVETAVEAPTEGVNEAEYRFRHRDGSWVWLASVATAREGEGESGFVVNSRDVTERRRREETLEEERVLYESVIEGINDALAILKDHTIVYANPQCDALLGYDDGTLVGNRFEAIIDPVDHDLVAERYAKRIDPDEPEPPSRYEVRFRTASGEQVVGEVNANRIIYGADPAVLVAIRDVTERSEYEEELKAANEELEALNRVVRHDIRNDMAVILGWAELLEEHVDEEGQAYLEKILRSGEHVVELTEIARDFVEALVSGETTTLRRMAVRSTLETELATRREFYPHATFVIDGELPDVEVAANEMLASVFTNLLNNAVQHNHQPEPKVVVSASVEDDEVLVRIADDGPGIPDQLKARLFGKGEKGLESSGTGIGLYLVRTILEQFGGSVRVEDNEPTGAVFVVRLPIAD